MSIPLFISPQAIAFVDALLNTEESGVKRVLVLCPVNTINNWKEEFFKWIPRTQCNYTVSGSGPNTKGLYSCTD